MEESDNRVNQARVHKGRGAAGNPANRFHTTHTERDAAELAREATPATEYRPVHARTIIARNSSPDIPFERSINPYQGCEHGCIYCYARPTHAYHDLSPGLDFETRLMCKVNAAQLLQRELAKTGYQCRPITLGANTDPYQPAEAKLGITRQLLEELQRSQHPFSIITKGSLITRDIALLAEQANKGLCSVAISVTTLNDELKRTMEPRTASGRARLAVIRELSAAGIPVTLMFAPVIPALNDAELEAVLQQGKDNGARRAGYILLRLPLEVGALFQQWLQQHYPMKAAHVMSLLRQCRRGAENDSRFGSRMRGEGTFADLLAQRFALQCRKLGLATERQSELRTDLFRPPLDAGDARQFDLFGR